MKLILGRNISLGVGVQHHVTLFAQKISRSLYFVIYISHGVLNYFPGLWGTGISDSIFTFYVGFVYNFTCNLISEGLNLLGG